MTARQAAPAVIGPRAETKFAAAASVKPSDAVKGARRFDGAQFDSAASQRACRGPERLWNCGLLLLDNLI
jgi:hypothetical protein